jgi:hypothetical protein
MASANKRITALTTAVWLAAAGSAAALGYELERPCLEGKVAAVAKPSTPASRPPQAVDTTEPTNADPRAPESIRLVARTPQRARASPTSVRAGRDISVMVCGDWRELDMGSGHVQTCQ